LTAEPHATDRVARALVQPELLVDWSLPEWEVFVRQARHAELLARIGSRLSFLEILDHVPLRARPHFDSALQLVSAQHNEVHREIAHLRNALAPSGVPLVLLKGAAYVAAKLPAAAGRGFADIDLLVPKARLPDVESALMMNGWLTSHHSAYDQRYYREWMHELPPMQHLQRGTVIDVHHTIVPLTSRLRPDATKLIASSVPVGGEDALRVLCPVDMVLHSMTHLFYSEELGHGLRDLSDIDLLLRHFSAADPAFFERLARRAGELGLSRPLFYGLRYAGAILETPVPGRRDSAAAGPGPNRAVVGTMDMLWRRALRSPHETAALPLTRPALFALYLRAHWLRMPFDLLARHLAIKAWQRMRPPPAR
jgi:hypothetical protein